MQKETYLTLFILFSISLSIMGCGGSDSSSNSTGQTATQAEIGVFIDSPVEGLHYSTLTLSGYTNKSGEFYYRRGEQIRFSIGNLELGRAYAASMMSPLSLSGENDLNNIGVKATNIARILQTLDNNSTDGMRLIIPTSLRDLKAADINLESEADINALLLKAEEITSVNYILKDSDTARDTMKYYIQNYNTLVSNNDVISSENSVDLDACRACHGQSFEKNALGHSKVVKDMKKSEVIAALIGYKYGTYGGDMKGLMKGQVAKYSDDELRRTGLGR